MASAIIIGLGLTAAAIVGRAAVKTFSRASASHPSWMTAAESRKFLRGGFEPTMTGREAAQILGVREGAPKDKIKQAHRKIMLANHPDRGLSLLFS